MTKKTPAGRRKAIFALLLLFGPAFLLVFISTRSCEHKFKTLDDFGKAIDYSFVDSQGKKHTSSDYKGQIVLITTIQETCPDSCAITFWHLDQMIYQHIRKNNRKKMKQVKIISFATDGKGNPLNDLTAINESLRSNVEAYDPNIWIIAKGDPKKIFDFKHNDQRLLEEGDQYFGGQAFQELILLLDKQNHLRMVLSGKTEGMIRRMRDHVALLQKQYDKEAYEKTHPRK